jgi:hypothetical protein
MLLAGGAALAMQFRLTLEKNLIRQEVNDSSSEKPFLQAPAALE